jgi:hypothetical protein
VIMKSLKFDLVTFFLLISLVTLPINIFAQSALNTGNVTVARLVDFDAERITVAGTAIGFTSSKINPTVTDKPAGFSQAQLATCVNLPSGAQITILTTGTDPTSSTGITIEAGQSFKVWSYANISAFRAIRVGSSSTLACIYSRMP